MGQKFYFFTDPALLSQQTPEQAYGPQGTVNGKDVFQATDIHNATAASPAFAICDGLVAAQWADNGTISIILKPAQQPPFDFPFISYFIYKGINPESLLNVDGLTVNAQLASTNALVQAVKKAWDLPDNENGTTLPSRDCLGLHLNPVDFPAKYPGDTNNVRFDDDAPLERLFYNGDPNIQLPFVRGGWKLGEFVAAGFGLDIVVERMCYLPPIALSRTFNNRIEVEALDRSITHAVTDTSYFMHWHDKEQCLNFIDPCALWGNAAANALQVWNGTAFSRKEAAQIYEDLLVGTQHNDSNMDAGNFFNRNFAYLDLRNEHGKSLDYYKADGPSILLTLKIEDDIDGHVVDYYASGWPCFRIGNANLPVDAAGTVIDVRLGLPRTNHSRPLVYISVGYKGDLTPLKHGQRFMDRHRRADIPYLEEVSITIAMQGTPPKIRAGYSKIFHFKRPLFVDGVALGSAVDLGLAPPCIDYLDNLFQVPDLAELGPAASIVAQTFADERYVVAPTAGHGGFAANITFAQDNLNYYWLLTPTAFYSWPGKTPKVENAAKLPSIAVSTAKNFLLDYVAERSAGKIVLESFTAPSGSSPVLAIASYARAERSEKKLQILGSEYMVVLAVSKSGLMAAMAASSSDDPIQGSVLLVPTTQQRFVDQGRHIFNELDFSLSFIGGDTTMTRHSQPNAAKAYQHVGF